MEPNCFFLFFFSMHLRRVYFIAQKKIQVLPLEGKRRTQKIRLIFPLLDGSAGLDPGP